MALDSLPVHDSWLPILEPLLPEIERILSSISKSDHVPPKEKILAALEYDFRTIRVVIVGQDPYPNPKHAMGLAFSIPQSISHLPPTLKNIFKELESDCGIRPPQHGDLSRWSRNGVLLLNRILTTVSGNSSAHARVGWQTITNHIAQELGKRQVVAILWGKDAAQLQHLFPNAIVGVHPSPLSAYRGFFGSRPFSRANEMLIDMGCQPIDWSL